MPKRWQYAPHDEATVKLLSGQLKISPLVAQVLVSRGFEESESATQFLSTKLVDLHDPELLPGVSEAADTIVAALKDERRITVFGDYDVDGMTSTSLLWHCLTLAGGQVDYYIPSRVDEGYGLNADALRELHKEDPNRLLVTVDCGIASVEEAVVARELGLQLIVTDHHQFGDELPDAHCLVHPRLPGTEYPFGELCGVGVAFKLAWAICTRLGDGKKASPHMREFLKNAVGLTAIGTIADVVPLLDENRTIVRYGLEHLPQQSSVGLQELLSIAKLKDQKRLDAEDISFGLAPRLNAAGRLGQARLAVELLTTEDPERARALARHLEELNKNRRTVERRILKQAKELVAAHPEWEDQPALILANHGWHSGVIGIVANRIAEHFEKPTFMIALTSDSTQGQGSGRSYGGCNLHAGLEHCTEHLVTHGGHQAAAGLRIEADQIDSFRDAFCDFVNSGLGTIEEEKLEIDAEVRLADVTRRAVYELDQVGPFGHANPKPIFAASRVELAEAPRTMGEGDRHLSIRVSHYGTTFRAVAFGRGEWAEEIAQVGGPISISFSPIINRFRGRENVELRLIDWQPAAQLEPAAGQS